MLSPSELLAGFSNVILDFLSTTLCKRSRKWSALRSPFVFSTSSIYLRYGEVGDDFTHMSWLKSTNETLRDLLNNSLLNVDLESLELLESDGLELNWLSELTLSASASASAKSNCTRALGSLRKRFPSDNASSTGWCLKQTDLFTYFFPLTYFNRCITICIRQIVVYIYTFREIENKKNRSKQEFRDLTAISFWFAVLKQIFYTM